MVLSGPACTLAVPGERHRRNLGQLGRMLKCVTENHVLESIIDYVGYGCYCGFGGDGEPLDATDECCQEHDLCYEKTGCNIQKYTAMYDFETQSCNTNASQIVCKTADEYDEGEATCKADVCQCDADIAECFVRTAPSYNKDYRRYSQSSCSHAGKINAFVFHYLLIMFPLWTVFY
ncbi:acidic phospholipase A2 CM-II-like [Saccoglossus kowalevskii]